MDEDLTRLWQIPVKALGPALKGAFQALWLAAGCEPNHIVITAVWLGGACGAEPRTAWGWLNDLARKGLLDILDRDEQRGTIQLYLYRPTVVLGAPPAADSGDVQGMLPLVYIPTDGVGPLCAQTPDPRAFVRANPRPSGLCARKGPRDEAPQSAQSAESSGLCARKPPTLGPLCAQRPDPPEETHLISAQARAQARASNRIESNRVDSDRVESGRVEIGISARQEEIAARPVDAHEAAAAAEAQTAAEAHWRRAGVTLAGDRDQVDRDRSLIRRTHVLVARGLLPESVLAEAIAAPLELRQQGRRVHNPAALLNRRLYAHPGFGPLIALVREPLPQASADPVQRSPPTTRAAPPASAEELAKWRDRLHKTLPAWKPVDP